MKQAIPPSHARRLTAHLLCAIALPLAACTTIATPEPLYRQLGGVEGMNAVSHAMVQRMATDPRTRRTFEGVNLRTLTASLGAHLCHVADGPCQYEGETMRNAHADLGITGSEFETVVQFLRDELDRAGVSQAAKNELLRRLAPTRRDIVTADR
jgi:hemoglobin